MITVCHFERQLDYQKEKESFLTKSYVKTMENNTSSYVNFHAQMICTNI